MCFTCSFHFVSSDFVDNTPTAASYSLQELHLLIARTSLTRCKDFAFFLQRLRRLLARRSTLSCKALFRVKK